MRRLERGRYSPTLETLWKLALGLEISLTGLFEYLETGELDERREVEEKVARLRPEHVRIVLRLLRTLFSDEDETK